MLLWVPLKTHNLLSVVPLPPYAMWLLLHPWFHYCKCVLSRSVISDCDSMDYSLPGSSVHRDSPGKDTGMGCHALFPRGSSQSRDQTQISHITGRFFTIWAMKKAHYCKWFLSLNLEGVIQKHWLDWPSLGHVIALMVREWGQETGPPPLLWALPPTKYHTMWGFTLTCKEILKTRNQKRGNVLWSLQFWFSSFSVTWGPEGFIHYSEWDQKLFVGLNEMGDIIYLVFNRIIWILCWE